MADHFTDENLALDLVDKIRDYRINPHSLSHYDLEEFLGEDVSEDEYETLLNLMKSDDNFPHVTKVLKTTLVGLLKSVRKGEK